jgi:hypothetical protein
MNPSNLLSYDDSSESVHFIEGIARREITILHMLFDAFAPSLYGKIMLVVKDPDQSVRILEKTMVYSVRHIQEHNPQIRLHGWLLQIASFKILEEAAAAVVGKMLPDDLPWERYTEVWGQLYPDEKEVLEWSTFRSDRHEDMAARLELPLESLQLRLSTALTHFYQLVSIAA